MAGVTLQEPGAGGTTVGVVGGGWGVKLEEGGGGGMTRERVGGGGGGVELWIMVTHEQPDTVKLQEKKEGRARVTGK